MTMIDIHTHGIGGYDTRTTVEDHILRMAALHGSYGVEAIIPTIYPATIRVMRENMAVVRRAMEIQKSGAGSQNPEADEKRIYRDRESPGLTTPVKKPATILGVHLEGPFLNPSLCGALNAMTFLEPSEAHYRDLVEGFEDMVKVITIAPELEGGIALIRQMVRDGFVVSLGHSEATYAEAEAGFKAGARGVTHLFNAMSGFHHREPGLAGFGLLNQDIYVEIIADPHHLHHKTLDLVFTAKNPERIIIVSDSVRESKIDSEDHAVADDYGTLLGGSMTVAESSKRLVEKGFDERIIMRSVTENPERYLGGLG